jgi:TnpA family transposase
MKQGNTTKAKLLSAFDLAEKMQPLALSEICKLAGVSVSAYFFHFYKDKVFRDAVLEKKLKNLSDKIASG